jgi:hypothetical protein
MVGGLNDPEGWDHLDNDAKSVRPVGGTADIDVDEIRNTGTFRARLKIPEGDFALAMDRAGGEVNPATRQIDFYIRSPQQNPKNRPARQVFAHFFGMEVTWK